MDIQLDDFQDGQPLTIKVQNLEVAKEIQPLKKAKKYTELLEVSHKMPSNRQKYALQSLCYLNLKKWQSLYDVCEKGLQLSEQNQSADFYNLKGKATGKLGNYQQMAVCVGKAVQLYPTVATFHRNLGSAYYKLKNYERAIMCHNKAIQLDPKDAFNYHNKGVAYFRMTQYQQAIRCFEKAVSLSGKQHLTFGWMGDSYKQMQLYDKAIQCYQKAYSLSKKQIYTKSIQQLQGKLPKKKGFFQKLKSIF